MPHPHPSVVPRVLLLGVTTLLVVAITMSPRQVAGPARAVFIGLAHRFAGPLVEPMSYVEVESALNAMLFVPIGAAVALALSRKLWVLAPVLVFLASMSIEYLQVSIPGRVPDIQDVVWNTIGGIAGAVVMGVGRAIRGWGHPRPARA